MKMLLKAFIYSIVLALITLFSVSLFWTNQIILTTIIVVISVIMLLIWRDKEDVYLYIIVAVSGAIAEAIAIGFGVWTYTLPDFIGIPIWLPFVWGMAGLFVKKISIEIHEVVKN